MPYWAPGAGTALAPTVAPGVKVYKKDGMVVKQEADGTFTAIDIAPWAGLEEWKDPVAAAPAPAQTVTVPTEETAVTPIPLRSGETAQVNEGTPFDPNDPLLKKRPKGTLLTPAGFARTLLV